METTSQKKIVVLIPCFNEAAGIRRVIDRFPRKRLERYGFRLEIIVIDNNSTDATAEIARAAGVRVITEPKQGKGNALRAGFWAIPEDTDYVLMLDGDTTYRPEEAHRLIELLDSEFCTVAIGSRLGGRIHRGAMTALNRAGNWFFTHLVRILYRANVTDVFTGYFAWTKDAVFRLRPHLISEGFAIEMEMITKMKKLGESIYAVPISYDARTGQTNLRPFYDGSRILLICLRNLFWQPRFTSPVPREEEIPASTPASSTKHP